VGCSMGEDKGYLTVESGPGVRFQIDPIVCDFYLVSKYNPNWIVGRPVLYFVSDVFSQMIVGYYVGLEGPSWHGFRMALANAVTDKVKHCRGYNIEINPSDWNCHYVPQFLIGDTEEPKGRHAKVLKSRLGVVVENKPPYRSDFKALVDRVFGSFHNYTKRFTPGYVDKDYAKRLSKDYRIDAKLNLFSFNQIIIRYIMSHNNMLEVSGFSLNERMKKDNVPPIPRDIWNWGIQNGLGKLKEINEDSIILSLFPLDQATVTRHGINYKNLLYTCDKAEKENWYLTILKKGSCKVEISYDPRNMDTIYLHKKSKNGIIPCTILPQQERYMNTELREIEYLHEKVYMERKKRELKRIEEKLNGIKSIFDNEMTKPD
jgi:hypothetical protein